MAGGRVYTTGAAGGKKVSIAVSPDGQRVYFVSDRPAGEDDSTSSANIWRYSLADPGRMELLASLVVLGLLVLIRTFLSWALVVEIEGRWPWQPPREGEQA